MNDVKSTWYKLDLMQTILVDSHMIPILEDELWRSVARRIKSPIRPMTDLVGEELKEMSLA